LGVDVVGTRVGANNVGKTVRDEVVGIGDICNVFGAKVGCSILGDAVGVRVVGKGVGCLVQDEIGVCEVGNGVGNNRFIIEDCSMYPTISSISEVLNLL
jgi:hypothetical protein